VTKVIPEQRPSHRHTLEVFAESEDVFVVRSKDFMIGLQICLRRGKTREDPTGVVGMARETSSTSAVLHRAFQPRPSCHALAPASEAETGAVEHPAVRMSDLSST